MEIHLDKVGNRIWMACRLRGDIPTRVHQIVGWGLMDGPKALKWANSVLPLKQQPAKLAWSFPLNFRTCLDLRAEFDDCDIIIHDELWDWSDAERRRRTDLMRIRAVEDFPTPVLDEVYPRLSAAVHHRAFQAVGIGYHLRAGVSVNGDHPGLGKTLQAIGAVVESQLAGPILVVAPAVAATVTWPDEMRDWAPGEQFVVAEGTREQREAIIARFRSWAAHRIEDRSWLFINPEMLQVERPPVRKRKGKAATWEDWLGLAEIDDDVRAQLDLGTVALEPAPDSPAARAAEEYDRAMEEYDPTQRRHPGLFEETWSAVIIDESHKILPAKSSDMRKVPQMRSGAQKLRVRPRIGDLGVERLALSGTPWRGNPTNQWGTLHWLDPAQFPSYWDYAERWFHVIEGEDYRTVESVRPEVERDFGEEVDLTMIRRTKAEVAPWLPSKIYAGTRLDPKDDASPIGVWIDMDPKQAKAYAEITQDAVARLESGDLSAIGVLAEMTRQKQFACSHGDVTRVLTKIPGNDQGLKEWSDTFAPKLPSNKWNWIVEFLDERGIVGGKDAWGDGKVVIGSWQTGLLNVFRAQLDRMHIDSLIITGETKNAERSRAKNLFQSRTGPRVFLLNTYAGGVSLTLDRADDMIVIDETWIPDDQEQLEDRIHRISRGEGRAPATYWYLRSRGTIDEHIALATDSKDRIQKKLMDGRRGVDYAKRLLTGGQ